MRTPLAFAFALVVAGIAAATATTAPHTTTTTVTATNGWQWTVISYPAATPGYRFMTDTLGGDGHDRTGTPRGITAVTDTRGGDGHPVRPALQGYRFVTDTLAPGGGPPLAVPASSTGFDWADAGVGAVAGIGVLLALTGTTLLVLRRRGRLAF